ncbi:short chain dehydrogenase [Clathrospora elynae]|uniref:Short chain dehydrogenase n=1 Tax=Clathrospora elynae TaxID=706981 RepID=A0A6A5SAR0_9PLEO|nr:short chain dehydrogenase [Clathrospora elynae]
MASGKRIMLVTGANTGIGYDTALFLARADSHNHVIVSARNEQRGLDALKKLQAMKIKGTLSFQKLDVASDESIFTAVKEIEANFDKLDVLVNNAGIFVTGPTTRAAMRKTFEVNVYGPIILTDALAPLLKKSNDPRIINVSSGLGSIGARLDSTDAYYHHPGDAYRMSKAALNMASANQKYNYREKKFKVWSYCPGFVITDIVLGDSARGEDSRKKRREAGAESSETSAQGILDIVEGKRDAEMDLFVQRYGKTWPW